MFVRFSSIVGLLVLVTTFTPSVAAAQQKRVIVFVDSGARGTAEGYYRGQNPGGGVHVCGGATGLRDSMAALVVADDNVVIVCHGAVYDDVTGGVIKLGGDYYSGFGGGTGVPVGDPPAPRPYGLPSGWSQMSIKVNVVACFSALDPDGGGARKSVVQSLKDALPNSPGAGITGFVHLASCRPGTRVTGGSAAQRQQAYALLENNDTWQNHPPAGSPGTPPSQQSAAQALIDMNFPNKNMTVQITYPVPPEDYNPQGPLASQERFEATSGLPQIEDCSLEGSPIFLFTGVPGPSSAALTSLALLLALVGVRRWRNSARA